MVEDQLRILVVEDDAVYAAFVGDHLRGAGHVVDQVTTAAAARAHAPGFAPDVVMLDLVLPDQSGYDLARALRLELAASAVIILLTADLYPERDLADAVGIDIVLTKPVEPALVTGMIDLVRARRRRKLGR